MKAIPKLVILALLACAACGDDIDSETLIGATCESSDDCDVTGVCVLGEGGLCTLPCDDPGAAALECPLGSFCDDRTVETEDSEREMSLCFPACESQGDCRSGYSCSGVSSGPGKVCVPED